MCHLPGQVVAQGCPMGRSQASSFEAGGGGRGDSVLLGKPGSGHGCACQFAIYLNVILDEEHSVMSVSFPDVSGHLQ